MKITGLIKSLGNSCNYAGLEDFEVCGITCNSKQVSDNFIFVAIKGARADGNRYIDEAISRGARAVIIQSESKGVGAAPERAPFIKVKDARIALAKLAAEFYAHPSSEMNVVGVTGTNGKTTVSYLLEALLKKADFSSAVIGTINYRFKDRVFPSKNTTPGPIELESMLAEMLKEGVNYAIMEVSSHGLDQNRTWGINFRSAIFTNLTQDHLDYHKTLERYFNAKARLFKDISSNSFVVINNDDRYARRIKKITQARIVTYGIEDGAYLTAKNIKFDSLCTEFLLVTSEGETKITSRLLGEHNVYNILAAAAWALQEGIDMPTIRAVIAGFPLVPGRLERIDFEGDFLVFVDYAHTEGALRNVISSLRRLTKKRIIVVFGCGGERDKSKRPKMGQAVSGLADYAIITNDNPRCEDPNEIINCIRSGITRDNYCVILERREAIKKSLSLARAGDIVLIAGKGHEDYQLIKDKTIHFSDREVTRECLNSMSC